MKAAFSTRHEDLRKTKQVSLHFFHCIVKVWIVCLQSDRSNCTISNSQLIIKLVAWIAVFFAWLVLVLAFNFYFLAPKLDGYIGYYTSHASANSVQMIHHAIISIPYVAVLSRNRTLFCCIFQLHCCVRSAVTQYFQYGWGSYTLCKLMNTLDIYTAHMSPTLTGSSALQHFKCQSKYATE